MTSRDLQQLKADELWSKGERAHRDDDDKLLRECIRELDRRTTDAAARAAEKLRCLRRKVLDEQASEPANQASGNGSAISRGRGSADRHIICVVSGKRLEAKPEEDVRQALLHDLLKRYGYAKADLEVEMNVRMGSARGRADIAIFPSGAVHDQHNAYIVIECKRASTSERELQEAANQLKSYMAVSGQALWGIATNGGRRIVCRKWKVNGIDEFRLEHDIPHATAPRARHTLIQGPVPSPATLVDVAIPATTLVDVSAVVPAPAWTTGDATHQVPVPVHATTWTPTPTETSRAPWELLRLSLVVMLGLTLALIGCYLTLELLR
jgi:hypothetical protein